MGAQENEFNKNIWEIKCIFFSLTWVVRVRIFIFFLLGIIDSLVCTKVINQNEEKVNCKLIIYSEAFLHSDFCVLHYVFNCNLYIRDLMLAIIK
ncbi:hypothetical protein WN943_004201 [Citrus x changshan-huyou]